MMMRRHYLALDEGSSMKIQRILDQEDASSIRALLSYDEDTAGGFDELRSYQVNINLDKKSALR